MVGVARVVEVVAKLSFIGKNGGGPWVQTSPVAVTMLFPVIRIVAVVAVRPTLAAAAVISTLPLWPRFGLTLLAFVFVFAYAFRLVFAFVVVFRFVFVFIFAMAFVFLTGTCLCTPLCRNVTVALRLQ